MAWPKTLSKKISEVLAHSMLYLPKGLLLPMAYALDVISTTLSHDNIYCSFHQKKSKKIKKTPIFLKVDRRLENGERKISQIHHFVLLRAFLLMDKLIPRFMLNFCRSMFIKAKGPRQTAKRLGIVLSKYRDKIIWYGLVPSLLLWGCVAFWGVGSIAYLYMFYITSYWSGKLLSQLSNLIVLGKKAPEWVVLKNAYKVVSHQKTLKRFYQKYRDSMMDNAKWLFLHLIPVVLLGGVGQFVAWCCYEFVSWLTIYFVIKKTAEQAPSRLVKFENYLKERNLTQNGKSKKINRLSNASWIVSYELFKRTASDEAQDLFQKLHLKSDPRYAVEPCSSIKRVT